ncbi:MAG: MBL fold metallo-hydrolase [Anaerolineales bacterium]
MIQLGTLQLYLIHDGTAMIDPGGMFGLVPRKLWSRSIKPDDQHLIPMAVFSLLVRTGQHTILIDTGFGENKLDARQQRFWQFSRPRGSLFDALGRLGLGAEDIDIVIDTHLHADHCLGNTRITEAGEVVPSFPRARYVVQRREYEDATQPNERTAATYFPVNYEPLYAAGKLELLDGETTILPGIRGVPTPGHTPGHMSVVLESDGQTAVYLCDMASMAVHFERLAWMTAYDVEPLVTLATKHTWHAWALETGALLFFPHDLQTPAGRLVHNADGRPSIQPEPIHFV